MKLKGGSESYFFLGALFCSFLCALCAFLLYFSLQATLIFLMIQSL